MLATYCLSKNLTAEEFPNRICFVDLAKVHDAQGVINALAQVIGIYEGEQLSLFERIKKSLKGKMLLLLDNFEQVLEAL